MTKCGCYDRYTAFCSIIGDFADCVGDTNKCVRKVSETAQGGGE